MRAAEQWREIQDALPPRWEEVELAFSAEDPGGAAAVLAPLGPGRSGSDLRLHVTRGQGAPERLRNLLERLDRKRLWGELRLVSTREAGSRRVERPRRGLAQAWDEAVAALVTGWSDLLCELELDSSDYLPRAALHCAPLNPTRSNEAIALRFRVSGGRGYGAAPGMARRCLERCDEERITGRVSVLHALADADNAGTQGPVWRIAGRSV
jgi:hypothetical protein